MKILYAMILHETNTFSCRRTDIKEWGASGVYAHGNDIPVRYGGISLYIGGMIKAAGEHNVELIPTIAIANTGPLIEKSCLDTVVSCYLEHLEKCKDEIDGICLAMHGAGVAEGIEDIEGYVVAKTRELIGNKLPITVSLDLHGNISRNFVENTNGLFGVKEYPHIDQDKAGYNAMKALIKIINNEKFEMGFTPIPMFIPCSNACTLEMPMKEFTDYIKAYENDNSLECVTLFHGFPYADIKDCRSSVVVVAKENAQQHADKIAQYVWENRNKLDVKCLSVDEALDMALSLVKPNEKGYIVINEASDNPGGGCPCDGTHLLRGLIERDIPKSILAYIHDPEIALKAHEAGVGGYVSGLLGAKKEEYHGTPIELNNALVCNLSDGKTILVTPMVANSPSNTGKTARLRIGNVEVIVVEFLPNQVYDDRPFLSTGADIEQYDIVCVKSTNHFRAFFSPRAKAIVTADPPGFHTANFSLLNYNNIQRPIYPLDYEMNFNNKIN